MNGRQGLLHWILSGHSKADCVFFFSSSFSRLLQFQNNNNYMNMAEANGALLAAGDVSILYFRLLE